MTTTAGKFSIYPLILYTLLLSNNWCIAQSANLDPNRWAVELSKNDFRDENFTKLISSLSKMDSVKAFKFLEELAQKGNLGQYHFGARFNCLKATVISNILAAKIYKDKNSVDKDKIKPQLIGLYANALEMAYRSEDDALIAFVSYEYAYTMGQFNETGISVMYLKNGMDLYEKMNYLVVPQRYQALADLLYIVEEYNESIFYAEKAILGWTKSTYKSRDNEILTCINTAALGYHRQYKYDSALLFYNRALQLARRLNHTVWVGIVSGNIGQIFYAQGKYDTAYTLLKQDYQSSKNVGGFSDAANSLQWAARTNLAMGNKTQALAEMREAMRLLKAWPQAGYLRNTYYTATEIFRKLGAYDSAFYYNNLYNEVNDSLKKIVATSSLAISKARLNDERSRYQIHNLKQDKRWEVLFRNVIIAGIVLLSVLALLLVNRRRLQEKLKSEKAYQEVILAKEQMRLFTAKIVEKTALIEKMERQAQEKVSFCGQHAIIAELGRQTILTEEDWDRFKALFETIHPYFFIKLKQQFANITVAEQRMAALIRIMLTTRQIATMLGISIDSVHKTRQRLRQRLHPSTDSSIEDIVATI